MRVTPVLGGRSRRHRQRQRHRQPKPSRPRRALRSAGWGSQPIPVFTYLANTIRKGDRQIPYSLVTAMDLAQVPEVDGAAGGQPVSRSAAPTATPSPSADAIVLNEWAAHELEAVPGDRIDIDYYLWDPTAGLVTRTASFTLSRVVPIVGRGRRPAACA